MPSTSPGLPVPFSQLSPGAPIPSLQSLTSFIYRGKRYIAYASGKQLNILSSPNTLVQALTFQNALLAICSESGTGKMVVADGSDLFVLEPITEGWSKIWWEKALLLQQEEEFVNNARHLSWGIEGEILVGGDRQLCLFSTLPASRTQSPARKSHHGEELEVRTPIWSTRMPSAIHYAVFSPSAGMIASCANPDRLVKIWRRLSYEENLFDYAYLQHPATVTHLNWRPVASRADRRRSSDLSVRPEELPECLYTIARDGILRVWITGEHHDLDILTLHITLDLVAAIPASPSLSSKTEEADSKATRYAFVLTSNEFRSAVNSTVSLILDGKLNHGQEHLKEVASQSLEVVVTMDGRGRMSAWGLQSIGHKRRPDSPSVPQAYHVAHAEGFPIFFPEETNVRFETWFEDSTLHLLAHSFDGEVQWWQGSVENFFSPSAPGSERLSQVACWSGHSTPVCGLRSNAQKGFLTWQHAGQIVDWTPQQPSGLYKPVKRCSIGQLDDLVAIIGRQQYFVTIDSKGQSLVLSDSDGKELASTFVELNGQLSIEDTIEVGPNSTLLLVLNDSGDGVLFDTDTSKGSLALVKRLSLAEQGCKGENSIIKGNIDWGSSNQVRLVHISKPGSLSIVHFQLGSRDKIASVQRTAEYHTGIEDAFILEMNHDFAAASSGRDGNFTMIDLVDGYVEDCTLSISAQIRQLAFAPTLNLLAAATTHQVELFMHSQYGRYSANSSWAPIRKLSIGDIGISISGGTWLADGSLTATGGNGCFVSDEDISLHELPTGLQEISEHTAFDERSIKIAALHDQMSKALPVWHPKMIERIFASGRFRLAIGILRRLNEKLKFWSPGDILHPLLGIPAEQLSGAEELHRTAEMDEETITGLTELLEARELPEISKAEQATLKQTVRAIAYCSQHMGGLDNFALRYLFRWKLRSLADSALNNPGSSSVSGQIPTPVPSSVPQMEWQDITFAYQSTTQQPLLDLLIAHYDNKITWPMVSRLGITAWLNSDALVQVFESLAQSAYRQTSPPDPINASIYFLAMHKKSTLLALWRIATRHKEQRATMKFLQRDFAQPEHRTAAKKNAYALMGKRRFDYAAAFFLLAEDPASATSLLAGQCNDIMLAIAVARLYSGDRSDMLAGIINDRLVPQAKKRSDRWLLCWCRCILTHRNEAIEALLEPLDGVRVWKENDIDALALYAHLRDSESRHEWESVLRTARNLRRLGLWLSALETVRCWRFLPPVSSRSRLPASAKLVNGVYDTTTRSKDGGRPQERHNLVMLDGPVRKESEHQETPSTLDGFTSAQSPTINDAASRQAKAAELLAKLKAKKAETTVQPANNAEKPKPAPTQFKEPDAESLLDSFGF